MVVSLHSTFKLTCRGLADLTWSCTAFNNEPTLEDKRGVFVSTVTINNATAVHTGDYTCYYQDGNYTEEANIYVYVPGMPGKQEGP